MAGNYSRDRDTQENWNINNKYSETGESEFSRESTIPFDQDEILSERHYTFSPLEEHGKHKVSTRKPGGEFTFKKDFRGKGPKSYRRSDEVIKEDVCETLYRSSEVDASEVEVFVNEGKVTLKGSVENRDQKKMAEFVIDNLAGVKDVFNELHIRNRNPQRPSSRYGLTDNITGLN